ncbi:hypothetical protein D6D12_10032 [Aureobasidium pullulans]|uniref:Uncharacterized protein n=1 Tax=Aureobasidium pullulans TaxID=5580 RepID=A0AB74JEJ5_AURPU|nr:hypothetical protein D6D12_10032 [Aureobasidium pullulans]THX45381.1 hypothetical protein D6D11_07420 [Aureobasidium pullulans]THX82650.1 hypothetical protein D6D08_04737 [Aureobasidium pullulans]
MISPPSALASAIDVDWSLKESCVISWNNDLDNSEEQLLGQPCSITLWIGSRVSDDSCVALLQVTIKKKFSGRAKFFDFFLFVDPHQIQLDSDNEPVIPSPSVLTLLLKIFPVPPVKGWLRASVQQGTMRDTPMQVLMDQKGTNFDGTSLHLLMQLRALSRADRFNIHLKDDKNVRKVLNTLKHEFSGRIPQSEVILRNAYASGGVWDSWAQYGKEVAGPHKLDTSKDAEALPSYSKTLVEPSGSFQAPPSPPSFKRAAESQEESSSQKRFREYKSQFSDFSPTEPNTPSTTRGHPSQQSTQDDQPIQLHHATQDKELAQDDNGVRDDKSTQDSQSSESSQLTHGHEATQEQHLPQAAQYTRGHAQRSNQADPLSPLHEAQLPPYAASITSSESDHQHDIKPTLFTRGTQNHDLPALTLAGLGDLITAAVQAHIPAIAAQVQQHVLTAHMRALAQDSIANYLASHMPPLMRGYLSELQDEWGSAAQDLHEVKDEAITDIHSEREKVLKEIQDESLTSYEDFKEKMWTLKDDLFVDLADKFTEFEEASKARIDASPPQYTKDPRDTVDTDAGGKNSTQEAARLFEHYHQGHLTIEQKVKVLLSIAKWNNADVFMAAGRDMQEALVKHWAGVVDYVSNSAPIFL